MDLANLHLGKRIATAGIAAMALLALFEAIAYWGFGESARDRNAFGFDRDTSFAVRGDDILIETAASRRFWPQRYSLHKPPGTLRVAAVGDSVFRGASLKDSVTGALARDLTATCGAKAEVWNLASPGYGSQRKGVVATKALDFAPDLLVYHAGFTTEFEDSRERARYTDFHSGHPRHWVDQLPFLGRLKLSKLERVYWNWLPPEVRATDDRPDERAAALKDKFDAAYWTPRMLANLDGTVDAARRARVPLVILVHAMFDPATGKPDDHGLDAAIEARYAGRPGVMVLSNRRLFARAGDVRSLFFDLSHWNAPGYELVAAELARAAGAMLDPARCAASGAQRVVSRPAP